MKAWFSSQPTRLDILRQITKGSTPLVRVLYAKPERDEIKPNGVHLWSDNDLIAEEIKREKAGAKVQPFRARQVARKP